MGQSCQAEIPNQRGGQEWSWAIVVLKGLHKSIWRTKIAERIIGAKSQQSSGRMLTSPEFCGVNLSKITARDEKRDPTLGSLFPPLCCFSL